ncbi:MAG: FAD:protein FMN transferase [Spirochaetaceae bacterium]|nr:FAD:protein FMN transferase [Spirochaetaceae bacterium]
MKKIVIIFILSILIFSCSKEKFEAHSENQFLMGTVCIITLYNGESQEIFKGAFDVIEKQDLLMSLQKGISELSKVNASSGIQAVSVSEDTYQVVQASKYYANLTMGAFDPTIAPLVELWGIGSDHEGQVPHKEEIEKMKSLIDYRKLEISDDKRIFLKDKGMKIDLGGIAKGYIADVVKEYLISQGVKRGIINLGGNIIVIGSKPEGHPWKIGIQDPFESRGTYIGIAEVIDKTIVTSGIYERFFYVDGKRYHHILDPETGYPVENDLASITIISEKSIDADALSTSLFVLGVEKGMDLIESIDNAEAVFVTKGRDVLYSSGANELFTLLDETYNEISLVQYLTTFSQ